MPTSNPTVKPGHQLLAFVDDLDGQGLKCVAVFDWDRTFMIPGSRDKNFPAWLKKIGLKRPYNRMVDITERPDIQVGEPFPFARKEAES